MKAITLHQPWASLIAIGAKRFETRSWFTAYRGELAIHAGKTHLSPAMIGELFREERAFPEAFFNAGVRSLTPLDFPRGAIVAVANLVRIVSTELARSSLLVSARELSFGDYRDGRWAWELDGIRPLRNPVPCTGARGLWKVPLDVLAAVEMELR